MKNIYELDSKDKEKFREEFNKLKFAKDINIFRRITLFSTLVCFVTSTILMCLELESGKAIILADFSTNVGILSIVVYAILDTYLNFSFVRWMKIKHKIEY